MRRLTMLALWAAVTATVANAEPLSVPPADLPEIVGEAFQGQRFFIELTGIRGIPPGWNNYDTNGERPKRITLSKIESFQRDGRESIAFLAMFPDGEAAASKRFRTTNPVPLPRDKPALVVAYTTAPHQTASVVLDEQTAGCAGGLVEAGDYVGDGGVQLKVTALLAYAAAQPRTVVQTERLMMYTTPDLRKILDVALNRVVSTPTTMKAYTREVELISGESGTPPLAVVKDAATGAKSEIPFRNGKFDYIEEDPLAAPAEARPVREHTIPSREKTVVVRLVDRAGKPIQGAFVSVSGHSLDLTRVEGQSRDGHFVSDAQGTIQFRESDSMAVDIKAKGYYHARKSWNADDNDSNSVTVVLDKEEPKVPMTVRSVVPTMRQETDHIALGLDFNDKSAGWKGKAVQDKAKASLWVELVRVGKPRYTGLDGTRMVAHNTGLWKITITGLNGWELAKGPEGTDGADDPRLRVAPESKYTSQLNLTGTETKLALFVRNVEEKRYGVLPGFAFRDLSRPNYAEYTIWLDYAVQAPGTDSLSLNPKDPSPEDL